MAKKQDEKAKITLERNYVIPLRREIMKVQRYKRAKKAITGVRDFLKQHMKSDIIKIDSSINLELWKHGIKNPPTKIKVTAAKDSDGVVHAVLFGSSMPEGKAAKAKIENKVKEAEAKEEEKAGAEETAAEVKEEKTESPAAEKKPEAKAAKAKSKPEDKQKAKK